MNRREFLSLASTGLKAGVGAAAFVAMQSGIPRALAAATSSTFSLEIAPVTLDLAPGVSIKTIGYNGQVPGPILRMKEGQPVEIRVTNKSDIEEIVHWHGLHIDPLNDGATEEGSPIIKPGASLTYRFTPSPSGVRWYHTHTMAMMDLKRASYGGQYGFLYIEPAADPGAYDHEVFLAIHHWGPSMVNMGPPVNGMEVAYQYAAFNGKLFSAQEPLKVKKGERVLFHFLNASATRDVDLALPGHKFQVIALDGNPVPNPQSVNVLSLTVAERVSAIVEMTNPGVWMLGAVDDEDRGKGLALPIEYAGATGKAQWQAPAANDWSYALFGQPKPAAFPDKRLPMLFDKAPQTNSDGMHQWTINGKSFPQIDPLQVQKGKRYRLQFLNATGEAHPMHLHRHSFELASINGKPTSGIFKDTVRVPPYGKVDVDFVASNPGPTLFHCHQQMHMDYGFMQMIQYLPENS